MLLDKPSIFLRNTADYIWSKYTIANRCLNLGKLYTPDLPGRSPRKEFERHELQLLLGLIINFI